MPALLLSSWASRLGAGRSGNQQPQRSAPTTSLRNVGVGLVIATTNFGGTAAVTAVLAYGIFEISDPCCWPWRGSGRHWLEINKPYCERECLKHFSFPGTRETG